MDRKFVWPLLIALAFGAVVPTQGQPANSRVTAFQNAPADIIDGASAATNGASNILEQGRLALAETEPVKSRALRSVLHFRPTRSRYFLNYFVGDKAAQQFWQDFLTALENARTDEQVGSGPQGGSTSLVSKAGAPAALSAAVENGAVLQTASSGPQATFRGNLVGIARLVLGEPQFPFCDYKLASCDSGAIRALKGLSFSVSVDAKAQTPVNVPVSGNATSNAATPAPSSVNLLGSSQRISAWSARYNLRNPRALDNQSNRMMVDAAVKDSAESALHSLDSVFADATFQRDYTAWLSSATSDLAALSPGIPQDAFNAEFAKELDKLIATLTVDIPKVQDLAVAAWKSFDTYLTSRDQALDALNNGAIVSLEYTNNSPLNQPRTSDFRGIVSWQATKTLMLTANLAAEIYNSLPAGAVVSRFRDAQAAVEADLSMPQLGSIGSPTLSLAGYYQYMHDPGLLTIPAGTVAPGTNIALPSDATVLLGQKGSIGIGQLKLTIPFKSTGVKFPVAVTWANRTELVKGTDVSGHIGISFDLDTLLAKSK